MGKIFLHELNEPNYKACFASRLSAASQRFDLEICAMRYKNLLIKETLSFDGKLVIIRTPAINTYQEVVSFPGVQDIDSKLELRSFLCVESKKSSVKELRECH